MTPDKIKKLRKKLKLNTRDFGASIGVSGRTVENWEQGRSRPERPVELLIKKLYLK